MGLRGDLIPIQLENNTPNTVIGFDGAGIPKLYGTFGFATALLAGTIGLVPAPGIGQQDYILSGNGWIVAPVGGGGGGGTVTGTGTAGRIPYWDSPTNINNNANLSFDIVNSKLIVPTINLSRAALPPGGIVDGDFLYDSTNLELRARINSVWTNVTKQDEITLPVGTTAYLLTEDDRNKIIVTSAITTVTITLPTLSAKFSCSIIKGGTGDVVLATAGTFTSMNNVNTITSVNGLAMVYHSGGNNWRGFGAIGSVGLGTVTNVTLSTALVPFLTVSNPSISISGTIALDLNTQSAEAVLIGPVRNSAAAKPTFRVLTPDSIPFFQFDARSEAAYTVREVEDRNRIIDVSGAVAHVITLPNGFPPGWPCSVWRAAGAGTVTFTNGVGAVIEAEANVLNTAKTMATCIHVSGGRWLVVGKLS